VLLVLVASGWWGSAACAAVSLHPDRITLGAFAVPDSGLEIMVSDSGRVIVDPDSGRVVSGRGATRSRVAEKQSRFEKPRWVMLRSLVVPGWGQAHNGAWYKAAAVAAGEVLLGTRVVKDQRDLDRLLEQVDAARDSADADLIDAAVLAYNDRLDAAFARQYLLGVLVVYAMVDAYVDAHFRHFKVEFETDPALPEGVPEEVGVRVGWEWKF